MIAMERVQKGSNGWMDGWNREQVRKEEDGNGII